MSKRVAIKDFTSTLKGHLDHFIDQGKYPIRVTKDEAKVIAKAMPYLKITHIPTKDDKYVAFAKKEKLFRNYQVELKKEGIPSDVLAEYWEMRYRETDERYEELYRKIKDLSDNY